MGTSSSVSCYKIKIDSTSLSTLLTHELNINSDMVTKIGRRKRTSVEIYYHNTSSVSPLVSYKEPSASRSRTRPKRYKCVV